MLVIFLFSIFARTEYKELTGMTRVSIKHKYVTHARKMMRADSRARITGYSTYIKRCKKGDYRIMMVKVSKSQRALRDMFADAQKLAKSDMVSWNRIRHWKREARRRKIGGAYRAAVSFYYKMLREHGEELVEVRPWKEDERLFEGKRDFYWVKFDNVE